LICSRIDFVSFGVQPSLSVVSLRRICGDGYVKANGLSLSLNLHNTAFLGRTTVIGLAKTQDTVMRSVKMLRRTVARA
jgi:hypothetical protein